MKLLREHIFFKVLTLLLVITLFAPSAVRFAHIFEHHQHIVCIGDDSTHIHKVDLDCEFQKFPQNKKITFASLINNLFSEKEYPPQINSQYVFLSKYQQLHFSLRGPPQLI